jgi:hypothetical protein
MGWREIVRLANFRSNKLEIELRGCSFNLVHLEHDLGNGYVAQNREPLEIGNHLTQKFDALAGKIACIDSPVTLPPGRVRLAIRPPPAGSVALQR